MLGSLILYLKGMRRMMFQLSGFYDRTLVYVRIHIKTPNEDPSFLNQVPQFALTAIPKKPQDTGGPRP